MLQVGFPCFCATAEEPGLHSEVCHLGMPTGANYDVRWSRRLSIVTCLVVDGSEYHLDEMMVREGAIWFLANHDNQVDHACGKFTQRWTDFELKSGKLI